MSQSLRSRYDRYFLGYYIMCEVRPEGENLSCYWNKTESVSLWNCPYDPWLTSKAYLSAVTVTDISKSSAYKMAAKINNWHGYGTNIRHCRPLYTVIDPVFVCVCQDKKNIGKRWWGFEMQWHRLDHMQTICTLLQIDNHTNTSSLNLYRPDALPDAQPTASKHRRHAQ